MAAQKQQQISARLLAYIAGGATMKEAFQEVFGTGYYECLVEELYNELRAKA